MRNIKIADSLVFIMLLFPFYTKAQQVTEQKATQENKQEDGNQISILIKQLGEKDTIIDKLENQINMLNKQLTNEKSVAQTKEGEFKQKENSLNETITQLKNEKQALKSRNDTIEQNLKDLEQRFKNLDKIIYKQCLYYTLEHRYNPQLVNDARQCLEKMDTKSSHPTEFETYRPFLDTYAKYNSEVKGFLKGQQKNLKRKGWNINEIARLQARHNLEHLEYYNYYKKKDKYPWQSIVYLDEVIDDYFKLLESSKINEKNLQELINKLPETETKVATETETKVIETEEKAESKTESKTKHKK